MGRNDIGQLGLGNADSPQPTPVTIANIGDISSISGGALFTFFLRADGKVLGTGDNQYGQLGDGTSSNARVLPVLATNLSNAVSVSAGSFHSLALMANGTVMTWGRIDEGQTGGSNCTGFGGCSTPGTIPSFSNVIAVDGGGFHSLALKSDGTVWAWGSNSNGQLGDGTVFPHSTPAQVGAGVAGFNSIVAISAGETHSIALKSDGTVWVWGSNVNGEIGNGTSGGNQLVPVQNSFLSGISQIGAGWHFNVVRKPDGSVLAWGFNSRGEMGNGTTNPSGCQCTTAPVIASISGVVDIKTAGFSTLARKIDGSIWAWGWNQFGEMGIGTADTFGCQCRSTPVQTNTGLNNAVFGLGYNHGFAASP